MDGQRTTSSAKFGRRPLFGVLGVLALALLLAAGCGGGGSEEAEAGGGEEPETPNINLSALQVTDVAGAYLAVEKGYFEDEGLNVSIQPVQNGSVSVARLLSGESEIIFSNYVSVFLARSEDLPLTVLAEAARARPGYSGVYVMPDSEVREPADLEGKTVAVSGLENVGPVSISAWLDDKGVDYGKVEFVEVPFPNMGQALEAGDVDAAWVVEPFTTGLEQTLGARRLFDNLSGPTDGFPVAGYHTTEQFAAENPNTVAAFQRALSKGAEDAAPEEVREVLPIYTTISPEVAEQVSLEEYPVNLDVAELQKVADTMVQVGTLDSDLDVSSFTQTE